MRLAAVLLFSSAVAAAGASLPAGFTETSWSGISSPTAMAVAPDGRIFVCQQNGALRVIKNGVLLATPFKTLTVDPNGERGLLGVAFDPNFLLTQYVYVYYTVPGTPPHNRLSRFTAAGDVAAAGSELPLLEINNLSGATNHNGGAIHFGADGKLYVAVGDNASGANAQSFTTLKGKILRVGVPPDPLIPPDNPFLAQTTGDNRAIWAMGFRNPFTFAVQPGTGRIFINDVGEVTWEEIDDGLPGKNYGWPTCEGPFLTGTTNPCTNVNFTNPVHHYAHGASCSIAGGAFYNPDVPQFPATYVGKYFFADYCGGYIKTIDPTLGTPVSTNFATGISSPVDVHADFNGNLYYIARGEGRVYKVTYTGSNSPTITENPQSQLISAGHPVTFAVSATGQAPLSFQWQRNSVDIDLATQSSYTLDPVTVDDDGDQFRCIVSNGSGSAMSAQATLSVTSNQPPAGTITAPTAGTTYGGGETIAYSGTATDPEAGALTYTWWVNFHHDTHFHPFLPPTTGSASGSITIPTLGETSANVWYRIHLQVTDSAGLTDEKFVDVIPRTTTMTLATSPDGLQLTIDGQPVTAPQLIVGVEGIVRTLGAPSPQPSGGDSYVYFAWSDGGTQTHDISTPADDTTYTASFTSGPTPTFTNTRTATSTSTPTATRTPTPSPTSGPTPMIFSVAPSSGPAGGGTSVTVLGEDMITGTLRFGGVAVTYTHVSDAELQTTSPALPPGTLNDVTLQTPVSGVGQLLKGWLADFSDVPQANPFHADIETIFRGSLTGGCGAGAYCPGSLVTRAQMAVFLLKGAHDGSYVPPACSGTVFADVPCPGAPYVDWINQLALEGITGGCGGGNYCPTGLVTRAQMAVFLLKAEHGGAYLPPVCSGTMFADVPCPGAPYVDWINQLAAEAITAGCGGGNYCPGAGTPRGQMATFLVRTFGLGPNVSVGLRRGSARGSRP